MTALPFAIAGVFCRQNPGEAAADRIVADFMTTEQVPGCAIALIQDGVPMFVKGYGVTDLKSQTPVTPLTVFPIASLSKPFVAMGIMKLAELGALKLTDPIGVYLPDLPQDWQGIPLLNVLNHTSGVPDQVNSGKFHPGPQDLYSPDDVYHAVTSMPLEFEAGSKYKYSNGNYVLLARIIETVSKAPYAVYLRNVIFEPLGMDSTGAMSPAVMRLMPTGYAKTDRGPVALSPINPTWHFGNGQLATTVLDLIKWDPSLHMAGILNASTLKFITTDQGLKNGKPVGYAMGWMLSKDRGTTVIAHNGRLQGFRSYFVQFVDKDAHSATVVILTNNDTCNVEKLGRRLVNLLMPKVGIRLLNPIPDDRPDLTQRHVAFLQAIASGTLNAKAMSPAMQQAFMGKHYDDANAFLQAHGDLNAFDVCERTEVKPNLLLSRYRMVLGKSEWIVSITSDAAGVVSGFFYEAP